MSEYILFDLDSVLDFVDLNQRLINELACPLQSIYLIYIARHLISLREVTIILNRFGYFFHILHSH